MKKNNTILICILAISLLVFVVPVQAEGDPSRGVKGKTSYHSKFAEISFSLPQGWMFLSDEDIAKILDISIEMFDLDKQMIENSIPVIDMMAIDTKTGTNVNLAFQKQFLTLEGYVNYSRTYLANMDAVSYVSDLVEITFAGKECLAFSDSISNLEQEQLSISYSLNDYFFTITVTMVGKQYDTDDFFDLLERFSDF